MGNPVAPGESGQDKAKVQPFNIRQVLDSSSTSKTQETFVLTLNGFSADRDRDPLGEEITDIMDDPSREGKQVNWVINLSNPDLPRNLGSMEDWGALGQFLSWFFVMDEMKVAYVAKPGSAFDVVVRNMQKDPEKFIRYESALFATEEEAIAYVRGE